MNELFLISDEAWKAATKSEVSAICQDLKELGLYHLPYPEVDIGVSFDLAVRFVGKDGTPSNEESAFGYRAVVDGYAQPPFGPNLLLILHSVTTTSLLVKMTVEGEAESGVGGKPYTVRPMEAEAAGLNAGNAVNAVCSIRDLLIALLATRNARKEREGNKLIALGIGKKKKAGKQRYRYVTTISAPHEIEDDPEGHIPSGKHRIPHLRRGHIRNQRFGPNLQFSKRIFIDPIFVNASEGFAAKRERYNLSN